MNKYIKFIQSCGVGDYSQDYFLWKNKTDTYYLEIRSLKEVLVLEQKSDGSIGYIEERDHLYKRRWIEIFDK